MLVCFQLETAALVASLNSLESVGVKALQFAEDKEEELERSWREGGGGGLS